MFIVIIKDRSVEAELYVDWNKAGKLVTAHGDTASAVRFAGGREEMRPRCDIEVRAIGRLCERRRRRDHHHAHGDKPHEPTLRCGRATPRPRF